MSDDNTPEDDELMQVVFADSFFDGMVEMGLTPEEQQELIDSIGESIANGTFLENSRELTPEEAEELFGQLEAEDDEPTNRTIN